jgi:hypothetical protein
MLSSTARSSIEALKLAIARHAGEPMLAPGTGAAPLPTGLVELDAMLSGGLPGGRLCELAGPRSSGKATLALAAAARASSAGKLVAWVDGPGELYPPAAAALGVELARLLVVRPRVRGRDAGLAVARAGEILARSRAFALVVLDLGAGVTMTDRAAARLRLAAHECGVTLCALSGRPGAVPHAGLSAQVASHRETDELARRRLDVEVARGGAPARARVSLGAPALAEFRARDRQLELTAAAEGIQPVRPRRKGCGA